MPWYLVAYFFGGAFVVNAIPHVVSGLLGRSLQTPFASPPFKGLSSPTVNVAWGLFNLAIAYVLVFHVGEFDLGNWVHATACFVGSAAMAFQCARGFGRIHGAQ